MCLAIPSKITRIDNEMATIDVDGVQRSASLMLLEDAAVGDYVIVHAGFAIKKLDEASAVAESIKRWLAATRSWANGRNSGRASMAAMTGLKPTAGSPCRRSRFSHRTDGCWSKLALARRQSSARFSGRLV